MQTALTPVVASDALAITQDQIRLIRSTVAKDATDAELELYLFDCRRRGVHPLDKLLHFSKRGGKYTPIVSIDYMRQRAAATHECVGIDDAIFTGTPKHADFAATVTVWRFVQGMRCAFPATARWSEYKPDQDFMWQRMPYLMLGKVAEALSLRRAFPAELSGLYERAELDQVDRETGEIGPAPSPAPVPRPADVVHTVTVKILGIVKRQVKDGVQQKFVITTDDHTQYHTFSLTVATTAKAAQEAGRAVEITYADTKYGRMISALREAGAVEPEPVL
jgi:phage recombination protein Bet